MCGIGFFLKNKMETLLFKAVILRKAIAVQEVMQNRQNVKNSLPTEYLCRTSKGLYLDKNSCILWRLLYWLGDVARLLHDLLQMVSLILSAYTLNYPCDFRVTFQKRVVKNISLLSLDYMMFSEKEFVKWCHSYHAVQPEMEGLFRIWLWWCRVGKSFPALLEV